MRNIKSFKLFESSNNFKIKNNFHSLYDNNHDLIDLMCRHYGIKNYTINDDSSIDVDGDVVLIKKDLAKLPLKFNRVTGDFKCNVNNLITLEGAPKYIGGQFWCNNNKLISLEKGPEYVGDDYMCQGNKLLDLKGCAKTVKGFLWCDENNIKTFDGFPENVVENFMCYDNPIYEIWYLFGNESKIEELIDCDIFRDNGNSIILDRLNEFLTNIGRPMIDSLKNYRII